MNRTSGSTSEKAFELQHKHIQAWIVAYLISQYIPSGHPIISQYNFSVFRVLPNKEYSTNKPKPMPNNTSTKKLFPKQPVCTSNFNKTKLGRAFHSRGYSV
jgi:hypothetical protein